jgi:hypothetical protein
MINQTITSSDITWASQANMKMWEELRGTPLGRIIVGDFSQRAERMDWLKSYIGPLIREVEPRAILGDSHLCGMVRQLWGERGVQKLRDKA